MPQLHRLIISFVTAITHYHHKKLGPPKKASHLNTQKLTDMPYDKVFSELEAIITECRLKDPAGGALLSYILHGIHVLKYLSEQQAIEEASLIEKNKRELVNLISIVQILFKASDRDEIHAHYRSDDKEYHLMFKGFLPSQGTSAASSASDGNLPKNLFFPLGIALDTPLEDVRKIVDDVVNEHQKMLALQLENQQLKVELLKLSQRLAVQEAREAAASSEEFELDDPTENQPYFFKPVPSFLLTEVEASVANNDDFPSRTS